MMHPGLFGETMRPGSVGPNRIAGRNPRPRNWLIVGLLGLALTGWGNTVGVWKVAPMHVPDDLVKGLEGGGWHVVPITETDLASGSALAHLDAILLPGGWDLYRLAGFKARRNLVKYVAGGKGLLSSAVSTRKWTMFAPIGVTTDVSRGERISRPEQGELSKAFESFAIRTNAPVMTVRVGAQGEPFALLDTRVIGAAGKAYGGRYVLFGGSFTGIEIRDKAERERAAKHVRLTAAENKALMEMSGPQTLEPVFEDKALQGFLKEIEGSPAPGQVAKPDRTSGPQTPSQRMLLACLDWLGSAPELTPVEASRWVEQADLDFLRVEKRADWTQSEDRWLGRLSVIPETRYHLALALDKRLYALRELGRALSGDSLARCRSLTNELQQAVAQLDDQYKQVKAVYDDRIARMSPAELTADNPFVDAAGVLKRIEAMSGRTATEKAGIIAVVNRCASGETLPDASLDVALYLHGQTVSEALFPAARLGELTARCDAAIAELRAVVRAARPAAPASIAERLRTDPLMMPYYTGNIFPEPQKAEYRDAFVPMSNVAIVVGKDVENPDPIVEILTERLSRYGGRGTVVSAPAAEHTAVVSLGDTELARTAQGLPAVPEQGEGYIVATIKAGDKPAFILKAHDRLGLVWSAASLMQLIHWRDGQTLARAATVTDYPRLKRRGAILTGSDFFHPATDRSGRILSYPDTGLQLQKNRLMLLVWKINEPCYQKLIVADCYSRDWKQPDKMPADAHIEEDLAALGRSLTPLGITWWAGIRPHAAGDSSPEELSHKLAADEESVNGLLYFARKTEAAGGHLSILLDDIRFPLTPYDTERLGTARAVDTFVVTNVFARLKQEYPGARLLVAPPFYWGPLGGGWTSYGEDREEYLRLIGKAWPPEIEVFWTGRQVNAATLAVKEHFEWWMGLTHRKPYFWQNAVAYWCHLHRRHYPTDPLDSLWSNHWEGQFDMLGWYGFNGGDIPRYAITDAISADFQWNPDAYGKEKQVSALRSVEEAANKFVGSNGYALMRKVTEPLGYFDDFVPHDSLRGKAYMAMADVLNKRAAMQYDIMEAKRDAVMASLKVVKETYPASISAWTTLESFVGVANMVDQIKANPALALYRAAVQQRAEARAQGAYDPGNDVFLAAADFSGGVLTELAEDLLDGTRRQAAQVAEGARRSLKAEFKLGKGMAAGPYELVVHGRQNATTGRMTLTLNGKPFFEKPAPFGKLASATVRFPIPEGLLNETGNVLAINLGAEETSLSLGGDSDGMGLGGGPPLAVHYAILKRRAGSSK